MADELEELRKQLAECRDPHKEMAIILKIKALEEKLGQRPVDRQ